MEIRRNSRLVAALLIVIAGCATPDDVYFDPNMDFGALRTVAVLPFQNNTREQFAAERVRDAFMGMLLATGAVYVLPPGEVARGMATIGRIPPEGMSVEQVKKLGAALDVDGFITGAVMEYGPVRSGSATANIISVSVQMFDRSSGVVVWSASSTKGGISIWDRLVGSGGEPMSEVTEEAVNDLLDKLFQ